jgi:Dolichyl-phosphate-mannose-protein mannosyltransferase
LNGEDDRPGEAMRWRTLGVLHAGYTLVALIIVFVRLAPRPPYELINAGSISVHGQDVRDEVSFRVPATGSYTIGVRVKTLRTTPAALVIEVRGEESLLLRETLFDIPGAPRFAERALVTGGAPLVLPLSAGKKYSCRFRAVSPGLDLDALIVTSVTSASGGSPVVVEAEEGRLAGAVMAMDPEASGGAFVLTFAAPAGIERLVQRFRAEADGLDGLIVNLPAAPQDEGVHVFVRRVRTGEFVFEKILSARAIAETNPYLMLSFPRVSGSEGEFFEFGLEQSGSHPVNVVVGEPGVYDAGRLVYQGQEVASDLVFAPRYATPWAAMAWLALPLLVLLVAFGFQNPRAGRLALALMLPLLSLVAITYWQREYQFLSGYEWVPDGYDTFATALRRVLVSPSHATFSALQTFLSGYPHAHSPLVPFLVACFMGITGDIVRAYLLVTLLFSAATMWCLLRLFERLPGVSWRGAWAATCLALTHFLFIRSAVRTSTDPAGYFFVVLGLFLTMECLQSTADSRLLALLAVLTLGLFARPTNLPLSIAAGAALFLAKPRWWARALVVVVVPPFLFLLMVRMAGLWNSFALAHEKALGFSDARTGPRLVVCLLLLAQLLWLPAVLARKRGETDGSRTATALGGLWFAGFLAFLLVSGAPYWNRHFLHALPGLLILVVPSASRLFESRPRLGMLWFGAHVALNLGLIAFNLHRGVGLGPKNLFD